MSPRPASRPRAGSPPRPAFETGTLLRNGEQLLVAVVLPALALLGLALTASSRPRPRPPDRPRRARRRSPSASSPPPSPARPSPRASTGGTACCGCSARPPSAAAACSAPRASPCSPSRPCSSSSSAGWGWRSAGDPAWSGIVWRRWCPRLLGSWAFVALALLLAGALRAEGVLAVANLLWVLLLGLGGVSSPAASSRWACRTWPPLLPSGALGDGLRAAFVHGSWPSAPWLGAACCGLLVASRPRLARLPLERLDPRAPRHGNRPSGDRTLGGVTSTAPPPRAPRSAPPPPHRPAPCCVRSWSPTSCSRSASSSPAAWSGSPAGAGLPHLARSASPGRSPRCRSRPRASTSYIEFGNRTLTGPWSASPPSSCCSPCGAGRRGAADDGSLSVLAAASASSPRRVLGGVTVLTGLHPATVARHFLRVDGLVVMLSALLVRRASEGDAAPAPLVAHRWSRAGLGHLSRVGAVGAGARHGRHRVGPALRRRRAAHPVRVRPPHHLLAARRRGDALPRAGRRRLASRPGSPPPTQRPRAGLDGGARGHPGAGPGRLRAVLHRPARGAGRRCTCSAPACWWPR